MELQIQDGWVSRRVSEHIRKISQNKNIIMMKRLGKIKRGKSFKIQVNNEFLTAYHGETLATVILSSGKKSMRRTLINKKPRGFYCGMGLCNECIVKLEDGTRVRACQTLAEPYMKVKTDE